MYLTMRGAGGRLTLQRFSVRQREALMNRMRSWINTAAIAVLVIPGLHARAQSPPALRLVPEARVDATNHDLSPIGWLLVGTDGTIIISQPQDHNIRFFSRTGAAMAKFGRKGKGPGEFEAMTLHGWTGDTLWIGDFTTRRITLIAPGVSLLRSNLWPQGVRSADPSRPLPVFAGIPIRAYYGDGSVLVFGAPATMTAPAWMNRPSGMHAPLIRVNEDGVFQRVVLWTHEWNDSCRISTNTGTYPRPLCFQPFWTVSQRGGVLLTAQVERSDPANDFVRTLAVGADGDTLFSRLLSIRRERVPAQVADSIRRGVAAVLNKSSPTPVPRIEMPETFPPLVQALVAVDENTIWFEKGIAVGDREWLIVDRSGQPTASLRVPRRIELKAVSMDRVWAFERDNDGLEHIVVYRLQR